MPQQIANTLENNFIGGLKTENNPLSFPENACTDVDNCVFDVVGEVARREGINFETNYALNTDLNRNGLALSSYVWKNASGDGLTQLYVEQIGNVLIFYKITAATASAPLSTQRMSTSVNLSNFVAVGGSIGPGASECQYADGNGFLFVFHPNCEPIYCSLNAAGTIVTGVSITVKIRDFLGVLDNIPVNVRPNVLGQLHPYNLTNQGWTSGNSWGTTSTSLIPATVGSHVFVVGAGLPVIIGQQVAAADSSNGVYIVGTATAYAGTNLTINITSTNNPAAFFGTSGVAYSISSLNTSLIDNFFTAMGIYPSNADVWWTFKDASGVFSPATTVANVTLGFGNAPQGHFVLEAFNQKRTATSGIAGLSDLVTTSRPRTGTWFQGRVWYAGVDASQAPATSNPYYTWTESIYFSRTVVSSQDFGTCFQENDPTSENFFDLLPTDGGVIQIQGCGSIYKLFPIQNGLLVFASNGIWFITGSQGIGFAANDYTVTKISGVTVNSGVSFVNVQGFPLFWNEEGIYAVTPAPQGGGLTVDNICLNTISSFYGDIPAISKQFARGDYNPLTFVVSWVFRSTYENAADLSTRYEFDRVLNFNTATKAFYPYSLDSMSGSIYLHDVKYVQGNGINTSAASTFKYLCSANRFQFTFSEEHDSTYWIDFKSLAGGVNYESFFTTGYKLHGQALAKFQPLYIVTFSRAEATTAFKIQSIWDFANSPNSGKYSAIQLVTNALSRFGIIYRRHKIRGRGIALQFKVSSVDGLPFNLFGWSTIEAKNTSV